MRFLFGGRDAGREWGRAHTGGLLRHVACGNRNIGGREHQLGLPAADQFQIDLRRQLGIEQRAMLAARWPDRCRSACTIRRANSARREFWPWRFRWCRWRGHRQSAGRDDRANSALRNFRSKPALWITSGASPRNSRSSSTTCGEQRLVGQEFVGDAVNALRLHRDIAFGIEIALIGSARWADDRSIPRSRFR